MASNGGSAHGSDGKKQNQEVEEETKPFPGMADVLEALELTVPSWSPPSETLTDGPATDKALPTWTRDEHERFVQAQQLHPNGPYEAIIEQIDTKSAAEVKSYGFQCWGSETYQQFEPRRESATRSNQAAESDLKVKDENGEPLEGKAKEDFTDIEVKDGSEEQLQATAISSGGRVPVKRHRVRRWVRETLDWCAQALSFRCLRRQQRQQSQEYLRASPAYDFDFACANMMAHSRDEGNRPSVRYAARTEETVFASAPGNDTAIAPVGARSAAAPLSPDGQIRRLFGRDQCVAAHAQRPPELAFAPPVTFDDDDDVDIRVARLAAMEIGWNNEMMERTAPSAPAVREPAKKSGRWSCDEHERYCEGLRIYRYGSWKFIADHVGTRTDRQVMSHAQSIRAKRKRTEEREKEPQTGYTPSKLRAVGQMTTKRSARITETTASSAPATSDSSPAAMRKLTPEEVLLASMANGYPTTTSSRSSEEECSTVRYQSDAVTTSTGLPTLTSEELRLNLGFIFHDESGAGHPIAIESTKQLPAATGSETCADTAADLDALLCSPPLDMLEGISYDEELFTLLDIPSTQTECTISTSF